MTIDILVVGGASLDILHFGGQTVRSAGGRVNRVSRTVWTSVPLVRWGCGGSGSLSIADSRKDSPHVVNDATLDGDSDVGSDKAMDPPYPGATTGTGPSGGSDSASGPLRAGGRLHA